jgi:hypothetical protein
LRLIFYSKVHKEYAKFANYFEKNQKKFGILPKSSIFALGISSARLAPCQLPQGLTAARATGCSGAMQSAYPFFCAYFYRTQIFT